MNGLKRTNKSICYGGNAHERFKSIYDGRKKRDPEFAENYDKGFQDFKLGVMLRQAREDAGLTQEELAVRISTKKTAISRIENHAEDMKLSTLEKFANALGKQLTISVA